MSLLQNFMMAGGGTVSRAEVTCSFVGSTGSTSEIDSYTFSDHSIGTAATGRLVVVGIGNTGGGGGTDGASSVTIAGETGTKIVEVTADDHTHSAIWAAVVDSGTTGDIVINYSRTTNGTIIGVWAVYNATTTVSDTSSDTDNSGEEYTTTLDIPASGVGIACAIDIKGSSATTHTWAGLTEQYDSNFKQNQSGTGAHKVFSSTQTDLTISCTPADTTFQGSMVTASWGP
jgi:hypothetical protein